MQSKPPNAPCAKTNSGTNAARQAGVCRSVAQCTETQRQTAKGRGAARADVPKVASLAPRFRDIEPLGKKHDKLLAAISCGIEPLDRYLKQQACQDARNRAAAPYVLVSEDGRIAGYYTLSSDN